MDDDLVTAFVKRSRAEQSQLLAELHSYRSGITRLWTGRTVDGLREVTAERVSQIEQEIARIEATIEFVSTLGKVL
jgi:hypothetical protein